jgi:signal peptidase I
MQPNILTGNTGTIPTAGPVLQDCAAPSSRALSFFRKASQFASLLAMAIASYLVVSHFFVQSVKVVGSSMAPTLSNSEYYLLNRWVLYLRAPERGEIVVLRDPVDNGLSVKRIVGLAGDTIQMKGGAIFINDQKVSEPYLPPKTPTYSLPPLKEQTFRCGRDQYFVLGDNRGNSLDGRAYGPISRDRIVGLIIR